MKTKRSFLFPQYVLLSIFCCTVFLSSFEPAIAFSEEPEFYYYSDGRKIALPLSKEMLAVRFKPQVTLDEQRIIVESQGNLLSFSERKDIDVLKITLFPLRQGVTEETAIQTINSLNANEDIEFANPVFDFPDAKLTLTDEFIVKFDPNISEAEIESFNALNNVEIASKENWTDWYVLRVKDPKNTNALIKMANLYYESPITEFAMPNFIRRLTPMSVTPDDTYFPNQWHLSNTGQSGGTPDSDIDAPEGWEISTGSNDIVIAIIDEGVDSTHPDLVNKLVGGRDFVPPYDNDPSPWNNDAHGTACAGLAAAQTNNGKGVAGVAWGCKIMPVRVAYVGDFGEWVTTDNQLALGIQWAADNGADVLNNSWGGGPDSPAIHNAIINAKNNGRNGKGCVIVFSSGNFNTSVSYPAKYPQVIAVGATDHNDIRWNIDSQHGSNYGPELDVVAPSAWGSAAGVIFWATDITGSAGYNPGNTSEGDAAGNYYKWFGGTSAAAPQVAGLAALILSVNPNLTSNEVQSIIESTADDKGALGWDQYYGWGRINVFNALAIANTSGLFLNKVDDINDGNGVVPGGYIHYTISYCNPPVGDPNYIGDVNNAVITDFLPVDLIFSSASGPNSVYHPSARTVTWNIGTVEPNESGSVTLTVKVNDCITGYGIITNLCKISGGSWARWARENTPVLCVSSPTPTCGEIADLCVCDPNLNLTWCPGRFASVVNGHEVYFGTNYSDVHDANTSSPNIYKGTFTNPSYQVPPSSLNLGTSYYWRIDEVNTAHPDIRWKGSVWSFTADCYLVENFNEYTGDDMYNVWYDHWNQDPPITGSTVYLRRGIDYPDFVRGGTASNSMGYDYDNHTSPYYSEARADVNTARPNGLGKTPNWLGIGAKILSLWFYGQPGNDANEPMYIKLVDGDSPSRTAIVEYSNYGDMNNIREPQWHQWNIILQEFVDDNPSIDLTNVSRITIGFGDGTNPSPALGKGAVYFEDIRLYLKRCIPGYYPAGDFDSDCVVDLYDFAIFALAWLTSSGQPNYNPICDISVPSNGIIDACDLARFCDYWLWQEGGETSMSSGFTELLYTAAPPCGELVEPTQQPQIEPQPEPELQPEPQPELQPEPQLQPEPELQPEPQPEPELQPEPQPELQPEPQPQPEPPLEPQPQLIEEDIQELVDWLEELWLTDEELRSTSTEAEWLEFTETIRQTPVE